MVMPTSVGQRVLTCAGYRPTVNSCRPTVVDIQTRNEEAIPMTDVAVVGAGPVGLLLAGDLAAAGVRTALIERRAGESNMTRAFGVHARTLEELDARGLADDLVATGQPVAQLRLFGRVHVDLDRLPSRFPYLLITPQYNVEDVLRRRAVAAGVEFV